MRKEVIGNWNIEMRRWILLLFLAFFIASCTSETTVIPVSIKTNTPSPLPEITQIPNITVILSPLEIKATQVAVNNTTKSVKLSVTPTPYPTRIPTFTPTPGLVPLGDSSISPDGDWSATVYRTYVDGETRMLVLVDNRDHSISWLVYDQPYIDEPMTQSPIPYPFHWSADENYFYFTLRVTGDGCWPFPHNGGDGLYQVNLSSGQVKEPYTGFATMMDFSPDDRHLAVTAQNGVVIIDIINGDRAGITFTPQQNEFARYIHHVLWSPDGTSFVFSAEFGVCVLDDVPTTIVSVDLKDFSQTILVDYDDRNLVPIEWLEPNRILIRNYQEESWFLNPWTGELTPIDE